MIERGDEVQGMPDRREKDVPARLVRFRLHGEPQFISLGSDVRAQRVDRLAVALQRVPRIFGDACLGALTTAPEHVHLSP